MRRAEQQSSAAAERHSRRAEEKIRSLHKGIAKLKRLKRDSKQTKLNTIHLKQQDFDHTAAPYEASLFVQFFHQFHYRNQSQYVAIVRLIPSNIVS